MPPAEPTLDPLQWVDRHADYLYRFALRTVKRSDTAEDLVQETLLAAWKSRDAFEGRAQERSWLTAILRRKMIDHLRSSIRDRKVTSESEIDDSADGTFGRLGHWRAEPKAWVRGTPDDAAERAEFWQVVRGCADKLPPRLREAFVLWHLDETPSEEVCKAIGITPNNLWVMLHRARLKMWQCLSVHWYGAVGPDEKGG